MRGLLVVNPRATTTSERARDVLVHALADQFHLEVVETTHRGHAMELGERAAAEGLDVLVTFGGDGTVNEAVNGLFANGGPSRPMFGAVPAGSANVFTRSLGLPNNPLEATGQIVDALRNRRTRTIGLGHVDITTGTETVGRYFTFNAGLGIDAEIIDAIERARAEGKSASPSRYLFTAVRQFFLSTDRKRPTLVLEVPGADPVPSIHLAIVQNTSPWTYLGPYPVDPLPGASFDDGLAIWAVRKMSVAAGLRYTRRLLMHSKAGSTKNGLTVEYDLPEFVLRCTSPTSMQVDGEGMGQVDRAAFRSVPGGLDVLV